MKALSSPLWLRKDNKCPKYALLPYNTDKMSGFHLAVHKRSFNIFPTHINKSPVFIIEWVLITTLNDQGAGFIIL